MTEPSAQAIQALLHAGAGPHVITVGNFDGVHRGHRYLIGLVVERARTSGVRSLVVTFEPHPTSVLRPGVAFERLTSPEAKLSLLRLSGIDDVVVVPFDLEFASLSPDEFLKSLSETVQPVAIFVGEGFRFGRGRAGDGATLGEFAGRTGIEAHVLPRLEVDGNNLSSSSIRTALHEGRIVDAERALMRRYRMLGTVEHGVARGRELGYPTANLHLPSWSCVPKDGIYAGYARVGVDSEAVHQAMIYIGSRPTFDNGERLVEVNLLDFSGDLYARELEIEFVAFVRDDQAFDSIDALVERIAADEVTTRDCLRHSLPEGTGTRISG